MSTEYIERGALIAFVRGVRRRLPKDSKDFFTRDEMLLNFQQYVDAQPAADVEPVVHEPCEFCAGTLYNDYALENVNGKYPKIVSCASANRQLGRGQKRFKCCPNCGRKLHMDERSDA